MFGFDSEAVGGCDGFSGRFEAVIGSFTAIDDFSDV